METVGVEAVVLALEKFQSDMRTVNSTLDSLRPSATLLQQLFDSATSTIGNFGREVLNVVETALGVMLRDAIEGIISALGDLISSIIETGSQFQTLKIRLTGLNLNDFADGTRSFASALDLAGQKTQEEITWLQNLGALTPFDPAQIADTYTQARAFGFSADEAQRLTTDIINFTAAMGLSNETLFLVIQNLGQMVQRGKITGTEIRDLARGSFLPLNDVLQRIAKNMGITVAELTKKISTPAGVPASEFVKAFEQMVEEEPRFVGAAGRLARAFVPAAQNVKELFTSVFGLNTTVPILDILGEKLASIVDVFVTFNAQGDLIKTQKWDDLVAAATKLGTALGGVINKLLGFLPSGTAMADVLISSVQGLADWITANQGNIVGFFTGIATAVDTYVIQPFIRISDWVVANWPTITGFFSSLGDIITQVFGNLFGGAFAKGDFLGGLLEGLKAFMEFVTANKDKIADWATAIILVVGAIQILLTIFNVVIAIFAAVIGSVVTFIGTLITLAGIITALPIVALIALLNGLVIGVVAVTTAFIANFDEITAVVSGFFDTVHALYKYFQQQVSNDPDAMNDWLTQLPIGMRDTVSQVGLSLETLLGRWRTSMDGVRGRMSELVTSLQGQFAEIRLLFTNTPAAIKILVDGFAQAVPAVEIVIRKFRLGWATLIDDIRKMDWSGLGRSIVEGIGNAVSNAAGWLADVVRDAVMSAYFAALQALGISSPSKLFAEIGAYTMEGFAQGVQKYANVAAVAMSNAMQRVAAPVVSMPGIIQSVVSGQNGSVSTTNERNYNLTIHSAAKSESMVQDFNMLQSLAG